MGNKINEAAIVNSESPSIDELSQIRSIVFGAAEHKLTEEITKLRSDMEQSLASIEQSFSTKFSKLQQNIEANQLEIDKKIAFIDKGHDENEANIQKSLENLYSEHEMFASATQQDFKDINQSLDNESSKLANSFEQQLKQLTTHLEKVSSDLNHSKADRKTLAKLLATMATNLADE